MGYYSMFQAKMNYIEQINKNLNDSTSNFFDPRLFQATEANKDNLHFGDAMKAHDKDEFIKAMEKEINDLTMTKVWTLIRKSDMPSDAKLIRLIWSFKRKRNPLGDFKT